MSAVHRALHVLPLAACVAVAFAGPGAAAAQTTERLGLGLTAAHTRLRMVGFDGGDERLEGLLYGAEGRGSWWRLHARGELRQGRLDREGPGGSSRVILARAGLGVRPVEWVALTAGPRITSVDLGDEDELIVRWQIEMHASGPIVDGFATAFASVDGSVGGTDMNWDEPLRSVGGEVGLLLGGVETPVWGRIGYRVDRELLSGGPWQSGETIYVSLGLSVPRAGGALD